jgi:crotonobetainyl-CoA:carnitine CoA-transferase CaiB-like acyl-CoA transferase
VFTVKDGEQIFLAAVSDAQWQNFCDALGFPDLKAEPELATNNLRVHQRPRLLATLRERLAHRDAAELTAIMERAGLPFAPIRKPADLLQDKHLLQTGGLADLRLPDGPKAGETVKTTLFPITMGGSRLGVRIDPPRVGEHTAELLERLGYTQAETAALRSRQVVG